MCFKIRVCKIALESHLSRLIIVMLPILFINVKYKLKRLG